MRTASILLFLPFIGCFAFYGFLLKKEKEALNTWQVFFKNHFYVVIILFCANIGCFLLTFDKESDSILIEKEDYAGDETEVNLQLKKEDQMKDITLNISPRIYSEEEAYENMEKAFSYLEEHIKGENESLDYVTTDLDFSLDEELYPFEMECISDHYFLVNDEGTVQNDEESLKKAGYSNTKEGIPVTIKITLYYQSYYKEKNYQILVYEKEKSAEEMLFSKVTQSLKQIEKRASDKKYVELPTMLDGVSIQRTDDKKPHPAFVWIFGVILSGLLLFRELENEKEKEKIRIEALQRCYPWFVNELVLLLGSGMQMKNIFALLVSDYKKQEKNAFNSSDQKVLIDELEVACHSFHMGMCEEEVYYQLGRRLKLPCYIKLMTLLEQNVKKGSKGMTAIMEQEEHTALETRKNLAKKYGEEAGTKLLGPMVLLLLIIMLIIMFPAFMSFQ